MVVVLPVGVIPMKVTSKGQVTIPLEIRQKLGIFPSTEVEFEMHGNVVRLVKKATGGRHGRGTEVVARLKGKANIRMSTEEILELTRK
jgi:AbrB family looped-hinge helix DNA binding protein